MKNIIYSITTIFIMALLISCSVKQVEFNLQSPENKSVTDSVVYVYRQNSMANIMVSPKMLIDTGRLVEIKNNQYQYILFKQNEKVVKHRFSIEVAKRYGGVHTLYVNIKPGEVVYLRLTTSLKFEKDKPYNRKFNLEQVDRQIALSEIRETRYAMSTKSKKNVEHMSASEDEAENILEEQYSIEKSRNPFNK